VSWRFLRALSCPARIIAAVSPLIPLVPLVAGFGALVAGVLVLRTYGSNYRVGRLLASTPEVSVAEARDLANGSPRYVRIGGRIDAEDEFEDDAHRPLVFRRTRLQVRRERGGRPLRMAGNASASRSATGSMRSSWTMRPSTAGWSWCPASRSEPPPTSPIGPPTGTPADVPVRLRVEQISSVEHAIVLGVPTLDAAGDPRISAGLGRPLVLTTLAPDEAIRLLTDGGGRRPMAAAACLAGGLALLVVGAILAVLGAAT